VGYAKVYEKKKKKKREKMDTKVFEILKTMDT
jgi:hypothetical protein